MVLIVAQLTQYVARVAPWAPGTKRRRCKVTGASRRVVGFTPSCSGNCLWRTALCRREGDARRGSSLKTLTLVNIEIYLVQEKTLPKGAGEWCSSILSDFVRKEMDFYEVTKDGVGTNGQKLQTWVQLVT